MAELNNIIGELPEIYQNIYGHPEYNNDSSRNCEEREHIIVDVVKNLQKKLGRDELKVLDLGCAQGYYCFVLAANGCKTHGIDFLDKNIAACDALQKENNLNCSFEQNVITQELINNISDGEYDVIMMFSVIHHICNEHGFQYARELFEKLAQKSSIVLTELALKDEPLYWNEKLPNDYSEWFANVTFWDELKFYDTHLSEVKRPFIVCSNMFCYSNNEFYKIDEYNNAAYKGRNVVKGKSYFICENNSILIKLFRSNIPFFEDSKRELSTEINVIQMFENAPFAPRLIYYNENENRAIEVTGIHYGHLLIDIMRNGEKINYEKIFLDILDNCCELEKKGLFHGDLRLWNVCIADDGDAFIIDFGNVTSSRNDKVAENQYNFDGVHIDVAQSFVSLIYDCLINNLYNSIEIADRYGLTLYYDFTRIPKKYATFIKRYLIGDRDISFLELKDLYRETIIDSVEYEFSDDELFIIQEKQIQSLFFSKNRLEYLYLQQTKAFFNRNLIIDDLQNQINQLVSISDNLQAQITKLSEELGKRDRRMDEIECRANEKEQRDALLLQRLDSIDHRVALLLQRLDSIDHRVADVERNFFSRLERKLKKIKNNGRN